MASVRIESQAFGDARFGLLGVLLGSNKREALGGMAEVWNYCTDQGTFTVRPAIVDAIFERAGAAELLIQADLAEPTKTGLRIRGTNESRTLWKKRLVERAKAAGKARAKTASRTRGKFSTSPAEASQMLVEPTSLAPAEASALTLIPTPSTQIFTDHLEEPTYGELALAAHGSSDLVPPPKNGNGAAKKADGDTLARRTAAGFVEWFNRRYGRRLEVSKVLVEDMKALLTGGATPGRIRLVVHYLDGLWGNDDKMRRHLQPKTMLRRSKYAHYFEEAKEAMPELWSEVQRKELDEHEPLLKGNH